MKDTTPTAVSELSLDISYRICRLEKKKKKKIREERSSFQVSGELKTILSGTFAREVLMYYPEGNGTLSSFLRNGGADEYNGVGEFSGYVSVSIDATTRRLTVPKSGGRASERKSLRS